MTPEAKNHSLSTKQLATRFVIGIGVVSLFADFTYEGGRSISGPFLAVLGASPFLVGIIGGVGEFLGYALRLFSGNYVDRTRKHWLVMYVGYAINLLALPALSLVSALSPATALIFAERLGKGLRNPARDAILARASGEIGPGFAFGLHEVLDQTGAFLGPLLVALMVSLSGYRLGFGVLIVPALVALFFLTRARGLEPPVKTPETEDRTPFSALYRRYLIFVAVGVAGFAHFLLIAYRFEVSHVVTGATIPLLYALAMLADAVAAFFTGKAYDRYGLKVLYVLPILTLPTAPLVFLGNSLWPIALGMALWGAAMGLQESLMRAAVADMTPESRRGAAYGFFDATYGAAWLVGSLIMGALYNYVSLSFLVAFSLAAQAAALVFLWRLYRP
jgi:MFS family permease